MDGKDARKYAPGFDHASIRNIKKNPFFRYKRAPRGYGKGFDKGFSGQLKHD